MTMGSHQSAAMKTDVWLTPPEILEALGPFDLDPCAPAQRPWDMAKTHYTRADNGLFLPWRGRVWLNPPYSSEAVRWIRRLSEHGTGTALIFARTETDWFFETVWNAPTAAACLFLKGRVTFHRPDGTRASSNAGAPSVLVAYGKADAGILKACSIPGRYVALDNANHNRDGDLFAAVA